MTTFFSTVLTTVILISPITSYANEQVGIVSLDLIERNSSFAVGEKWSVFASVNNMSNKPIWITSKTSLLTIPTEILGSSGRFFAQFAFLPSLGDAVSNDYIRINSGEIYTIEWYVDGIEDSDDESSSIIPRFYKTLSEFLLFKPSKYPFSAVVHYWDKPPVLKNNQFDLSETEMVSVVNQIQIEGSIIVLIFGAAIGGLFAYVIRSLVIKSKTQIEGRRAMSNYLIGASSTMFFCVVGVILLERLASSDFPIAISVKDFWGAIAIGLVLEWWGLEKLRKSITSRERSSNGKLSNNEHKTTSNG